MSTGTKSKTSPASVIFRIGIVMLILAALALRWVLNAGDPNIFTGLFLIMIFLFVIPTAAIVLLISGLIGSAELIREKKSKKAVKPLVVKEDDADPAAQR